jgi:hypothetical protein
VRQAVEVAVGDVLPEMQLYLTPDLYVNVPLEQNYLETYRGGHSAGSSSPKPDTNLT